VPHAVYKALTIAGSDSGAGAGIQADLKTFAALGVYGSSVITAVTAQNTRGVTAIQQINPDIVAKQLDAVMEDIGAYIAKTGMLCSAAIVEVVASGVLRHHLAGKLVIDPVLIATTGESLLDPEAVTLLKEQLLPLALVLTPNIPEAEALTGRSDMKDAARCLHDMGARWVVIKGGHASGDADDLLFDGRSFQVLHAQRIGMPHTHGTGCTFSAAITASLAKGLDVPHAMAEAKRYVTAAIERAYPIGSGSSPVHHLHPLW